MSRGRQIQIAIGLVIVLAGITTLLENLGIISLGGYLWGGVFLIGGLMFAGYYRFDPQRWWALIPSAVLLSLGVVNILEQVAPDFGDEWGGTIFMGGFSLGFLLIYLINRQNWWAIIPFGVMATIALISSPWIERLETQMENGLQSGGLFLLGLGITFMLVFVLPSPEGRNTWAIYPAGGLLVIGILIMFSLETTLVWVIPGAMILVGILLLARSLLNR